MTKRIGVLSLQGGFARHIDMVADCGHEAVAVRHPEQLDEIHGLILPGGESTTIAMLLKRRGLADAISGYIAAERPVFGTCAGLILLAREVDGRNELHYSALDISVERNSYGSQVESFEADLDIDLGTEKVGSFPAVFIRAPRIVSCGSSVRIHGSFNGDPVLVSQGKIFAATFHPELTDDPRLHRYFIELGTRGS